MQQTMTFPRTRQGVRNLDAVKGPFLPVSGGPAPVPRSNINVGSLERWGSTVGGSALAAFGLSRGSLAGLGLALLGSCLVYRGVTGHCHLYDVLGVNTAEETKQTTNAEVVYRPGKA